MFDLCDVINVPAKGLIKNSIAERSKALVLGTSLFGGVGSNPTAAIRIFYKKEAPSLIQNNDRYFKSNSSH